MTDLPSSSGPSQLNRTALPIPKLLPSASSSDILKFLIWKDKSGRTKVQQTSCPELGKQKASSCECPSRLSAGTVDSLIGKLRAIFTEAGLGGEWMIGWG